MFGNHSGEESDDYTAPLPTNTNKAIVPLQQPRPAFTPQRTGMPKPQQQQMDTKSLPTAETPHKAIFAAVVKFTPRDLFKLDKNTGKPIALLNDGKIVLSVSDGTLTRIWCDHAQDFEACDKALVERIEAGIKQMQQQATPPMGLAGHHGMKKKKKDHMRDGGMMRDGDPMFDRIALQSQQDNYSDIVQTIELKHVTSTWSHALNVEFPSVKKFKNESYATQNVGVFFIPNKLSAKQGKDFTACQRVITNGNMNFSKEYPKTTLASLDKDMSVVRDHAYIDFSSAFFSIYNSPKWGNEPYTQPTHKEQNQVMMTREKAEQWMAVAKAQIADFMCHGNVTRNFQAELSVPMPFYRRMSHQLYLQGHPDGVPFEGFADKEFMYQGQNLSELSDEYLDTQYTFNAEFHVQYFPGQH